jgi:hypothetical protein
LIFTLSSHFLIIAKQNVGVYNKIMRYLTSFLYFAPLIFVIYFLIKRNNKLKNIYQSDVSFHEGAKIIRDQLDDFSVLADGGFEEFDTIESDINSEFDQKKLKSKKSGDAYLYSIIYLFFRKHKVFGFIVSLVFILLLLMRIVF